MSGKERKLDVGRKVLLKGFRYELHTRLYTDTMSEELGKVRLGRF